MEQVSSGSLEDTLESETELYDKLSKLDVPPIMPLTNGGDRLAGDTAPCNVGLADKALVARSASGKKHFKSQCQTINKQRRNATPKLKHQDACNAKLSVKTRTEEIEGKK